MNERIQAVGQHNETVEDNKVVGMFVITHNGEILLQASQSLASTPKFTWQPPLLSQQKNIATPISRAKEYLETIGLDGQLYEVFTLDTKSSKKSSVTVSKVRIVVALVKTDTQRPHFTDQLHQWKSFSLVLRDVQNSPTNYAEWFRATIEGVALFLKNVNTALSGKSPLPPEM